MKEEGFVNKAFQVIRESDISSRFIANQALFNGPDDKAINPNAKVAVIFALSVFSQSCDVSNYIDRAHDAKTVGEIRGIIDEASKRIS